MKFGIVYGRPQSQASEPVQAMVRALEQGGHTVLEMEPASIGPGCCDMIVSVGGDGTFLSVAPRAAQCGIPVIGVNSGRMGFLSENTPQDVAKALLDGDYTLERRRLLCARTSDGEYVALNEVALSRASSAMLGIKVAVDGKALPTYWADGLLVATASGSTAYSLSVGGPIVLPASNVLIIAPIAPHNLNVRPLVVPAEAVIDLSFESRCPVVNISADNNHREIPADSQVSVAVAQFSLNRVCLKNSNFIKALSDKLFWGEDIRNGVEL